MPLVTSTGDTVKPVALHTVAAMSVIDGTGLTVTVRVTGAPTQAVAPGPVGVIVYVTTTASLELC